MNRRDIGIRALDMQTGLYNYSDSVLDLKMNETLLIGKAASLVSHLRGIQVINDYEALIVLASKLGITAVELYPVLEVLQELELVWFSGKTRKPEKIEVMISAFENTYDLLGEKWLDDKPSEFERKIVEVVNELSSKSISINKLKQQYDIDNNEYLIMNTIGNAGGFLDEYESFGERVMFSPIYMEDNPKKVLDVLNQFSDEDVSKALNILSAKPGYPIIDIRNIKNEILLGLLSINAIHTPAIHASGGKVNFLFTPFSTTEDKEMLRQARNVVAAVRYGEKFSKYSQLRNPAIFLQCLLDKGYIGKTPHSDIEAQYGVLRDNGLGRIEEIGYKRYRFYLSDTQYAKDILANGDVVKD